MRTRPTLSPEPNEFGYYEIRWAERRNGKYRSRRKSTGQTEWRKAVQFLNAFLADRFVDLGAEHCTLSQAFDRYLRHHSIPRGNEKTDRQVMRAPLQAFGSWPACGISDMDVETYTRQRIKGGTFGKPVKPQTVRRELNTLQAVINYGVKKGLIRGNKVAFPKPEGGQRRDRWLTEEQQREIASRLHEASLDVRIMFRLAATYGARRGAIMDLRFGSQVDFIANTIDFRKPGARQNRKRRPTVPMTRAVRNDMEEMFRLKGRDARVCALNTPKEFKSFMEGIGYGWVTPHVLKHTAITQMLRAGVSEIDVSRLTETDLRTIKEVYRHHTQDELLAIAEGRFA